jgi:hypothetical protein
MTGSGRELTFVHIRFVFSERLLCVEERKPTSQRNKSPLPAKSKP